ncbi:MAG: nucleotidyltransferase family protein [Rubricoccaceae bacterium]
MPPAIVLAGGLGTRLRSVVADRPKVLAPVAGEPFLAHLLRQLERSGVPNVVLATGYGGEQVEEYLASSRLSEMTVQCVREKEPLGTGGALAFAAREAGIASPLANADLRVLALNGDTFFGGDLAELAASDAPVTLALAQVADARRFGRVALADGEDPVRITGFEEKGAATGPAWINAGVYHITLDALAGIEPNTFVSFERDVMPELVAGRELAGIRFPEAPFLDIGTPEDYDRAADVLAAL